MNKNKTILKEHQKLNNLPFHIEIWKPDNPIPVHYHDCAEMLLTTGGTALCQVDDLRLKFSKGDLFLISGDVMHALSNFKNFTAYRILFDLSLLDALSDDIKNSAGYTSLFLMSGTGFVNYSYHSSLYVNDYFFKRIIPVMAELLHEYETGGFLNETHLRVCFSLLVTLILKCYDDRINTKKTTPIDGSFKIIMKHLNEKINIAEIAESFGISERYFRRLFTERWGVSPAQFITDFRMRKAKTLLTLSDMSITEIAMTCGFCDNSHFSNVFTKNEGISPREYRKSLQI